MKYNFELCAFADEADSQIDGQIRALQDNGISYIELRGVDGKNISAISSDDAKMLKQKFDKANIKVWAIGSPTGKMDIADNFSAHLDSFKHMLEIAGILGASNYRLFSFYGVNDRAGRDTALEYLQKLIDTAKGSGIVLCHENEKDIYGEKAPACLDIHKNILDLKAVFDPANFIQAGQDTLQAWELLGPYVEYMHIKDALPGGAVVPAGKGVGNIPVLLEKYAAIGGHILTVEPHLAIFSGLDSLEHGRKSELGMYVYPDNRTAFDAGVDALKKLL
jgi:sugar phosphate isomerase/epimerase